MKNSKESQKAQLGKGRKARASFFFDNTDIDGDKAFIRGSDARHIRKVLRLKKEDELKLFDNKGYEYTAKISSISDLVIETRIIEKRENSRMTKTEVILGICIPKTSKMEMIIQKCVEIGVAGIYPLISERTMFVKKNHSSLETKKNRWLKIAYEAVKQCGRANIPDIKESCDIEDFIRLFGASNKMMDNLMNDVSNLYDKKLNKGLEYRFILSADIEDQPLSQIIDELRLSVEDKLFQLETKFLRKKVFLIVGPEGGFSDDEKKMAMDNGFLPVKISSNVLKVETAAILGVGLVIYEFERF
jgi:16S rRNA (uracil1498-N3)-methyltransferase